MRNFWPELLLASLFLLGDLFLGGYAVAAGAGAGAAAFLVSLLAGKPKPSLLLEGLLLSAITLIAEVSSFPGGAFAFAEITLGLFLLVAGLRGKPALTWMAGSLGRNLLPENEGVVLSVFIGGAFLIHGGITTTLSIFGRGGMWLHLVLLAPLAALAGILAAPRLRRLRMASMPVLFPCGEDGVMALQSGGDSLGKVRLTEEGRSALVQPLELEPQHMPLLERAIAHRGFRFLSLTGWPHDELHLEIGGFIKVGDRWRKLVQR